VCAEKIVKVESITIEQKFEWLDFEQLFRIWFQCKISSRAILAWDICLERILNCMGKVVSSSSSNELFISL
jgi:hypothetical protein